MMNGYLPTDSDFKFQAGGWNCAVGHSGDGADVSNMQLVIEKVKGSNPTVASGWESVHTESFFVDMAERSGKPMREYFQLWLDTANAKLKAKIGAGIPTIPADKFGQLLWYIRYGMAFRAETLEVYLK